MATLAFLLTLSGITPNTSAVLSASYVLGHRGVHMVAGTSCATVRNAPPVTANTTLPNITRGYAVQTSR
jgi:hypothetical protein